MCRRRALLQSRPHPSSGSVHVRKFTLSRPDTTGGLHELELRTEVQSQMDVEYDDRYHHADYVAPGFKCRGGQPGGDGVLNGVSLHGVFGDVPSTAATAARLVAES